jgi:hypothetical protein
VAGRRHPLDDLEAVPARDERRRAVIVEVVHGRPVGASDLIDVPKALRGQEPDRGVPVLEQSVETGCRAMYEELDLGTGFDDLVQDLEHAGRQVARSRKSLSRPDLARARRSDEIGESPPNVDRDRPPAHQDQTLFDTDKTSKR